MSYSRIQPQIRYSTASKQTQNIPENKYFKSLSLITGIYQKLLTEMGNTSIMKIKHLTTRMSTGQDKALRTGKTTQHSAHQCSDGQKQ